MHIDMAAPEITPPRTSGSMRPDLDDSSNMEAANEKYGFTPRPILKSIPRAWQRKPSTPFAPRSDSHKIWKRIIVPTRSENNAAEEKENPGAIRATKRQLFDLEGPHQYLGTKFDLLRDNEIHKKPVQADSERLVSDCQQTDKTPASPGNVAATNGNDQPLLMEVESPPSSETAIESGEVETIKDTDENAAYSDAEDLPEASEDTETSPAEEDDDTLYLHAFLTRTKASKANREQSPVKAMPLPDPVPSPMTRSRAAEERRKDRTPSPKAADQQDQVIIPVEQQSPLRKSTRTRLPRLQPATEAPPCTISLRRSKGTEFIFLPQTEEQQVAVATRSNTRKNKGEATAPKTRLKVLSTQPPSPSKGAKNSAKSKQVSWAEGTPLIMPDIFGVAVEEPEKRKAVPKRRSSRSVRGTPAPKRRMEVDGVVDPSTPATKTRKSRSRTPFSAKSVDT